MIDKFIKAWDANKDNLRNYFSTHEMKEYDEYRILVCLLFEKVINPYIEADDKSFDHTPYDIGNIHEIDDGDYQGTLLYIIPKKTYQPCKDEYVITNVGYGSCSCCDTLQGITCYDCDKLPDHNQIDEFMTLCLHILQQCKIPYKED